MAYGKIKADAIIRDNSGTDEEVTMASLVAKAGLASPAFTGTPTAPTAAATTDSTQVATTAYVKDQLGQAQQWTAGQRGQVTTVTQSNGTLAIDFDASNNFYVLPTANITSITYTNLDAAMIGQSGSIFFQQPNSGNFTIGGWANTSRWAGGTGGSNNQPTFTATANTTDRVDYVIASTGNTTTDGDVVVQLVHTANYAE